MTKPAPLARSDLVACGGVLLCWLAVVPIIGVSGEFSLSDDWAYVFSTRHWLETGEFQRSGWTFAPIVTNVAIGVFFSKLFGFSIATLRASSIAMGALGILGAYALARELGARPRAGAVAAAALAFNPIYLSLSFSFMTDVAFAALFTWSLVFFARGIEHVEWRATALGLVVSAAAILSRQPGIAVPAAVALIAPVRSRKFAWWVLAGAAVGAAAAAMLGATFAPSRDEGEGFSLQLLLAYLVPQPSAAPYHYVRNTLAALPYLGLFALPVLPFLLTRIRERPRLLAAGALGALLCTIGPPLMSLPMPPGINMIYDFGLGPVTLAGGSVLPSAGRGFWTIVIALGGASGGIIVATIALALWRRRSSLRAHTPWLVTLVSCAIYLAFLMARSPFFDRYLIAILPAVLALSLACARALRDGDETLGRPATTASALATLALAFYAIAGTHDYLEHHRARASLIERLREEEAPRRCIDAGFEFAGSHLISIERGTGFDEDKWAWIVGNDFLLSYASALPGYEPIESRSYAVWLHGSSESITLHVRPRDARHPDCR